MGRASRARLAAGAIALLMSTIAPPTAADAARGLTLGFGDPAFSRGDRGPALDRAAGAGGELVRIGVNWASVAPSPPLDAANPADPVYRFADVDASVRAADERGFEIVLELGRAPAWAEGAGRPVGARPGTWRPDPGAYGQFARAVARRYNGDFAAAGHPLLPRVTRFQAGNEPNLSAYLTPQWEGDRLEAARVYRELLRSFHAAVKGVDPANLVITGGTAPYGEDPGGDRSRPVTFLRELLCLRGGAGCDAPVPFDVLAHHPINAGAPSAPAEHPDDATTPDIDRIRGVLRDAERRRTVTAGSHPIWVTEFWWESDPPDDVYGVPEMVHARYHAEALHLFWKQRVPVVLGLQLADDPVQNGDPAGTFQTGLYFADGRPKKGLTAFRFPFVAERARRGTKVWGRAPEAGKLVIERRSGKRWRPVARMGVKEDAVFKKRLRGGGRPRLRARVAGERSLPYRAAKR
jgi:hypothetical protein